MLILNFLIVNRNSLSILIEPGLEQLTETNLLKTFAIN